MPAKQSRWVRIGGSLALLLAAGAASVAYSRRETPPNPPLGLPAVAWPGSNPYSREKAALGRLLFFDRRLSSDGSISCASCHDPRRAFADRTAVSSGIGKRRGRRNAPAIINRAYGGEQLWDARAASLEEQAKAPLADRAEMTSAPDAAAAYAECVERLRRIAGYRARFRRVFGTGAFTLDQVAMALAAFERTLFSGNSPYDRYAAGDRSALTEAQVRGRALFFGRAQCSACHGGPNFTSEIPSNTGVGLRKPRPDLGRVEVTHLEWETGAFKPPTLREIEHTAPYMHDGSLKTLADVVEFYNKGGGRNVHLDDRVAPLHLTKGEKADLVAFMKALSGEGWQVRAPRPEELPQ